MSVQINQLVKSLLKKDSLNDCSLDELDEFANRHPYFGAAQLLLTKKLKEEKSDRYNDQLQKTFLFFNNPLWVQHLLNDTGGVEIIDDLKVEEQVTIDNKEIPSLMSTEFESAVEPSVEPVVKAEEFPEAVEPQQQVEYAEPVEHKEQVEPFKQLEPVKPPEPVTPPEPTKPQKDELLFEPFYTVDYFASQGIKMKDEQKPTDRFGKQLRSFTDWLKTMKKLPVADISKNISPAAEQNVQKLAEHSLDNREVLTETMAEVWEKQGNHEKAVEIYEKLSLLDPSKSVYFAAKIEGLKKKN